MTDPLPTGDVVLAASYSAELLSESVCIARAYDRQLRIVHVIRDVDWLLDPRPPEELLAAALRRGQTLLDDLSAVASRDIPVCCRLLLGSLYDAMLAEATTAGAVVTDDPLLLDWLRPRAACPVVASSTVPATLGL